MINHISHENKVEAIDKDQVIKERVKLSKLKNEENATIKLDEIDKKISSLNEEHAKIKSNEAIFGVSLAVLTIIATIISSIFMCFVTCPWIIQNIVPLLCAVAIFGAGYPVANNMAKKSTIVEDKISVLKRERKLIVKQIMSEVSKNCQTNVKHVNNSEFVSKKTSETTLDID